MSKNRGSVLQVVLVIFLVLFTSLFSYCVLMTRQYELTHYQKMMNQQRRIEILLRRYWRSTIDQDILLGDTFEMQIVCSFCGGEDGPLIISKTSAFICENCARSCVILFEEKKKRREEINDSEDGPCHGS